MAARYTLLFLAGNLLFARAAGMPWTAMGLSIGATSAIATIITEQHQGSLIEYCWGCNVREDADKVSPGLDAWKTRSIMPRTFLAPAFSHAARLCPLQNAVRIHFEHFKIMLRLHRRERLEADDATAITDLRSSPTDLHSGQNVQACLRAESIPIPKVTI
jgi:hypothetical protein